MSYGRKLIAYISKVHFLRICLNKPNTNESHEQCRGNNTSHGILLIDYLLLLYIKLNSEVRSTSYLTRF